jgi:hypothetical protein
MFRKLADDTGHRNKLIEYLFFEAALNELQANRHTLFLDMLVRRQQ